MKIAFFVVKHIRMGGGIEKYTEQLGKRLVARGHDVTVYSMKHYGDMSEEYNGLNIVGIPSLPFRVTEKISASAVAAMRSLFTHKPDIMHFHSVASGVMARVTRFTGIPSVLQMHGIEWQRSRWGTFGAVTLRAMEKKAIKCADAITAVSRKQCQYIGQQYGLPSIYIPTGTNIKQHALPDKITELGLEPKHFVLFASRLVSEKGAHYLVDAFKKLGTDMKLVIAGDSNDKIYVKNLKDRAKDDGRIIFPGFVHGQILDELFSNAYLYVHPSEIEGLSIAVLEAMSYGNACLASDIPENVEAVNDCGFYFRNKSPDDLRNAMSYLIDRPDKTQDVSSRAIARVRDHFTWDAITDDFEMLYSALVA